MNNLLIKISLWKWEEIRSKPKNWPMCFGAIRLRPKDITLNSKFPFLQDFQFLSLLSYKQKGTTEEMIS